MFNIRTFELKDEESVVELLKELTTKEINFNASLLIENEAIRCRVVEYEGNIVGFGALVIYPVPSKGMVGRIEDIIVSSAYRGRGWGKKLVEDLISLAKKENLTSLYLTSNPSRIPARNLYESLGFTLSDTGVFWMGF